jgi:hypothetical protein
MKACMKNQSHKHQQKRLKLFRALLLLLSIMQIGSAERGSICNGFAVGFLLLLAELLELLELLAWCPFPSN